MNTEIFEKVNCNLCGADNFDVKYKPSKPEYDFREVFSAAGGIMGTQQIVVCQECGLTYVSPRVKTELVASAYENSTDEIYVSQSEMRALTFKSCLNMVERLYPGKGRILDVGAASGVFLKTAGESGWEIYGVEPSKWLSDYARTNYGINIKNCTLKEAGFAEGYFDVVTMWDMLEHSTDPLSELKEAYRIMKPGGLLVINYPDFGTLPAKLAGKRWWFLLSNHLFYFSRKTMTKMLNKTGFEVRGFRMHFQALQLGYLAKMLGLYSRFLSAVMVGLFNMLHLKNVRIRYYASQTNVAARKI